MQLFAVFEGIVKGFLGVSRNVLYIEKPSCLIPQDGKVFHSKNSYLVLILLVSAAISNPI